MKKILIIWLIIQTITLFMGLTMDHSYNIVSAAGVTKSFCSELNTNTSPTVVKTQPSRKANGDLVFDDGKIEEPTIHAKDTSGPAKSFNHYFAAWLTISQLISFAIIAGIVVYLVLGLFINKEMFRKNRKFYLIYGIVLFFLANMVSITKTFKPMIYLYPENDNTAVTVTVDDPSVFTCTYPEYNDGWSVIANSDGTLFGENGRRYYGLYWEGNISRKKSFKDGFLVESKDTAKFLEEKLEIIGLNEREAEEFIVYWLPILEKNRYNLIHFKLTDEINSEIPLNITPKPDTVIRVVMQYKAVPIKVSIEEQKLEKIERKGFTVVEWGGEAEEGLLK